MSENQIKPLRIAFMGTPEFSVGALQALIHSDHDVVCVYSQPPRPKGRGQKLQKSAVHQCAENAGIEVRTPINFKENEEVQAFENLNLDVAVVAAYGLILPQVILDAPQYGCINIHASILPRWRGAAPIHRAILAGDDKTGVTLMQMDAGLDTGGMIGTSITPIRLTTTLPILHDLLSEMGAKMIVPCMNELSQRGALPKTPQPEEGMTYAKMLTKQEGRANWSQTAIEIDRQVRALNPWPGTWSINQEDKHIKILEGQTGTLRSEAAAGTILENGFIVCGDKSTFQILKIQPENKKPMDIKTALNGDHIKVGDVLL
jgi:methionyl-tRNA formyltransferase